MCFRRSDGKKVKNLLGIDKAIPYFMPMRIDAVNLFTQPIKCENVDKFVLEEKKNSGVHYNYTEILMAACVRMLYERPKINRFINNCVIYQRNTISISINVKKTLTDEGEEVALKLPFTGRESLAEVKKIFENAVEKVVPVGAEANETTKTVDFLGRLPSWMFKFAVACMRFMDKHNILPKKLIKISPFHTSIYITDLRSIKLDKIYHHLYNFGTTTMFGALGKIKYVPVADRSGEITVEKRMELGLTLDERVADGLYYGNSVKLLLKYLENPELLKEPLPEPEVVDRQSINKAKKAKKKAENQKEKLVYKK